MTSIDGSETARPAPSGKTYRCCDRCGFWGQERHGAEDTRWRWCARAPAMLANADYLCGDYVRRKGKPSWVVEQVNEAYAEIAPDLWHQGYSPIPLADGIPRISGWPAIFCHDRPHLDDVNGVWSRRRRGDGDLNGVGVATHGGLTLLRVRADLASDERLLQVLPELADAVAVVRSDGAVVYFVRGAGLALPPGGPIETGPAQTFAILPPSGDSRGRTYAWANPARTLLDVALEDLPLIEFENLVAASLALTKETAAHA